MLHTAVNGCQRSHYHFRRFLCKHVLERFVWSAEWATLRMKWLRSKGHITLLFWFKAEYSAPSASRGCLLVTGLSDGPVRNSWCWTTIRRSDQTGRQSLQTLSSSVQSIQIWKQEQKRRFTVSVIYRMFSFLSNFLCLA